MTRATPLHRTVEDHVAAATAWQRRAMADGRIDREEAHEGAMLLIRMLPTTKQLVRSVAHIATTINSEYGLYSEGPRRDVEDAHQGKLIPFPTEGRISG